MRFIQIAAVAGLLMPGLAFAQSSEQPAAGATQQTGSPTESAAASTTTTPTDAASPSPASPAPSAAPESTTTTTTTTTAAGATTTSTTTTTTVAPAPAELVPFRNSTLLLDQSTTPETIYGAAQLTSVPSYQWWISFRPRWYFTRTLSLRARADLTVEWTNGGADTTLARQPQFGDIWTDLVYGGFPELAGIKFSAGVRALWPVSLASRMRGTYIALGATVGATRAFDLPGHAGTLNLGLSFAGTHAFTAFSSGGLNSTYGCSSLDINVPATCDSAGGPMNSAFNLMSIITAGYDTPVRGLGINLMMLFANQWAYTPPPAIIHDTTGGYTEVPYMAGANNMRQLEWFLASVDYELVREVSLSVGYYVYRPVLNPDSTYGNPFWSPGGNSRIFFTVTLALDGIYQSIRGVPRERAGAHASNTAHPGANQLARDLRAERMANGTF